MVDGLSRFGIQGSGSGGVHKLICEGDKAENAADSCTAGQQHGQAFCHHCCGRAVSSGLVLGFPWEAIQPRYWHALHLATPHSTLGESLGLCPAHLPGPSTLWLSVPFSR